MEDPLDGWETAEHAGSTEITSMKTAGPLLLLLVLVFLTRYLRKKRSHGIPESIPSHPNRHQHRISHRFGLPTPTFLQDDDDEEDITARELKALQQSPEFQAHIQSRGINLSKALQAEEQLRALRHTNPKKFFLLARTDALVTYSQNSPSPLTLLINYILGVGTSLLLLILLPLLIATASTINIDSSDNNNNRLKEDTGVLPSSTLLTTITIALLLAIWSTLSHWVQGRPSFATLHSLYYEDLVWGHLAGPFPSILANILEVLYVVCTLGIGMVVSVGLRCWSPRRQSVGEMIAAIRCIQEKRIKQKLF